MAGASAERQETGVVKSITDALKKNKNNPITIIAGKTKIANVIGAEKFTGRQISGSEPYTDVILFVKKGNNTQKINLSLKGDTAPSLAGGGMRGLELAVPGITKKFMVAALNHLVNTGLKSGDKVPDVYGKIGSAQKLKIVIGNEAMGGPIDFMYIGSMDVLSVFDIKKGALSFSNGSLIPAAEFARTHELYFRLRARREDQRFDPSAKDNVGVPKVYGKSPSRGDSAGRIMVTDKVPSNANIVKLQ